MITIIFEPHATSIDNEQQLASGHNDIELSVLGEQQARELGQRYATSHINIIFCSDLQRSYMTAELAFGDSIKIVHNTRLRECDYGDLTQKDKALIDTEKPKRINTPFPNGESYEQTSGRMKSFLEDLLQDHDNQTVMIIGHRATQYGLEHLINKLPLFDVVTAKWAWQPGWQYSLENLG